MNLSLHWFGFSDGIDETFSVIRLYH